MAEFYANENFPLPVVERLRALGHDVPTVRETGKAGMRVPNQEVLAFATLSGRAVLTINRRHFIRLHRDEPSHAGIVACTFDPEFVAHAERIHAAVTSEPDLRGKLVRVNRPAT